MKWNWKKTFYALVITGILSAVVLWWVLPWYRRKTVMMSAEDENVKAFLEMIRFAEGTSGPDGYNVTFGYHHFTNMSDHPVVTGEWQGEQWAGGFSTAAGAFQIIKGTWLRLKDKLKLPDFSPESQRLAAIELLRERKVLDSVKAGRFEEAIKGFPDQPKSGANKEWASLPDSPYGQPVKTMAQVKNEYVNNGGNLA